MKIFIATDHAGFELKKFLIPHLEKEGHEIIDCGAHELKEGDDYPLYISTVARTVSECEDALNIESRNTLCHNIRGIIIGGSGQGEAIVANRFPRVRAAVYYGGPTEIITLSRQHNDANIISLGARFMTHKEALDAVHLWIETDFLGGKHERRIEEIEEFPNSGLFS